MSVATTDLDELIALIDEFGAEAVCSLLVAYGYARDGRPAPASEQTAETVTPAEDDTAVDTSEN